ncbi:glutamine--fructose-6-phosphate transaminase [Thermodesulfitimonas autotrophica]|uniref:Glutamine--fructose-6-phosphate aminotransferase [isomerizing] n=1 Tax=Thermodesulfitimonas autotrophica TaxID=1894989 RepID=A0A3N5AB99_9THEO|nr:glutamine--fructose-6-phosphate transaminase (isomerizing) [Thermodesulfitimonas autotrophica]RPF42879.1 glutamine--fructose-6-phosphate transaminase [Thermodesulfitimonas autotrophica]
MCGIIGYTGKQEALPLLIAGLKRLEYRGYDSAGVAVIGEGRVAVCKKEGKIAVLEGALNGNFPPGRTGIGHTRWATHGAPTDANAHPHLDCTGRLAVVHNGIIENYLALREQLVAQGHRFVSETDTEVIPHLLEEFYEGDLLSAVKRVIPLLRGSFALAAVAVDEPTRVVAARFDSPLIVGLGEDENFVASDIPAILAATRRTYVLDDGEIADVRPEGVTVYDRNGSSRTKEVFVVNWDAAQAEKAPYPHFMLKEIHEQPQVIRETLRGRIEGTEIAFPGLKLDPGFLKSLRRLYITACGTAYHAGLIGKMLIERLVRIPVEADIASEFRYRDPLLGPGDLLVVVSQSGETADTLAALREAKAKGATVLAITNVVGSSVAREAHEVLYTWAGPEIAVASTKAYVAQVVLFTLLAVYLARLRESAPPELLRELAAGLPGLSETVQAVLAREEEIAALAGARKGWEHTFFIGRGLDWAVACEGALKLKEISYIHAEAYAAGELKHGTLALVTEGVPVIALATQPALWEKMQSNIREVKARGADVLAVTGAKAAEIVAVADEAICLPPVHPLLAPVVAVVPLQLFAYYAAVARGCDVDRPRNLAKSVTVE